MYSKNLQNFIATILIAVTAIGSSVFASGGSIMVYNNSLYKINVIVTPQNSTKPLVQASLESAPINSDGTLVMHPTDANYLADSNVPMGTVSNILFRDSASDFDIAIMDAAGTNILTTINVGKTLGTVVDNDPARAVYVYSNLDSTGKTVANSGASVYFWDANHSLTNPAVQTFIPTTAV
jgi:hypothetical protein